MEAANLRRGMEFLLFKRIRSMKTDLSSKKEKSTEQIVHMSFKTRVLRFERVSTKAGLIRENLFFEEFKISKMIWHRSSMLPPLE